jgi:hypothetical protein
MESMTVRSKIIGQIQHMLDHTVIKSRRFLDDEQLIKAEQLAVLEEIFNANVRDAETVPKVPIGVPPLFSKAARTAPPRVRAWPSRSAAAASLRTRGHPRAMSH